MDTLPGHLMDNLTLFNTSLGVICVKRLHDLGILTDDDLEPARESLSLLAAATNEAASSELGATFAEMIVKIVAVLPALAPEPSAGAVRDDTEH